TGVSKTEFTTEKIKLYQRELEFSGDKTIYTEENTQANITLSGGKSGEKVEWSLSGDATLGSHDTTFNRSGYAYATITSKAPFKTNPVINVNTIGQNVSTTIAYVDKEYTPSIVYPNYRGHEKTVNLNQDFNLEVSNLIPNTEIEIYHNILSEAKPKQDHVKVNSLGKATLEFNGVWIPTVDKFYIKFKYMKTKNKSADFSTDYIYIYKQDVKLVLDVDKDSFGKKEGEVAHAVLKGGKSGEKVEWNLSGDATLGSHDTTFNASGEAKATITSKAPFKANPVIRVSAMGKNLSKTITYGDFYKPVIVSSSETISGRIGSKVEIKVTNGKPNSKVKLNILSGDGSLSKNEAVFSSNRETSWIELKAKAPFNDVIIEVETQEGIKVTKKIGYIYYPEIVNRDIIDYYHGGKIKITGLRPHSISRFQNIGFYYVKPVSMEILSNDKGESIVEFEKISPVATSNYEDRYSVFKFSYENPNKQDSSESILDIPIHVEVIDNTLHFHFTSYKSSGSCYKSENLAVDGGLPNEPINVDWSLAWGIGMSTNSFPSPGKQHFDKTGKLIMYGGVVWCTGIIDATREMTFTFKRKEDTQVYPTIVFDLNSNSANDIERIIKPLN
ncbi:hypothetical protein ACSIDX_000732, partial [Campylobacter lari]